MAAPRQLDEAAREGLAEAPCNLIGTGGNGLFYCFAID